MKNGVKKSEYVKLIRRTETELKRELKKPDALRDNELVSECVESLSYYRGEYERLRAESGSALLLLRFARSALAAVLVLAVTFALGATVAQAAGFRVWTAIFRGDSGYLRVDYVPEISAAPTQSVRWEDAEKNFFTFEEFDAELVKNGFGRPLGEWNGYEFFEGGIRSTEKEYYASYTMRSEEGYIRVRMIAKAEPDATSVWGLDESIPIVRVEKNGVSAAYQSDGDYAFATWQEGNRIFSVSVYRNTGCTEALLNELIKRS